MDLGTKKVKVNRSPARGQSGHFAKPGGGPEHIHGVININKKPAKRYSVDSSGVTARIKKNKQPAESTFGATVALAVGGATFGSLLGPVGAVLGAVGGGVIGAVHQGRFGVGRKS